MLKGRLKTQLAGIGVVALISSGCQYDVPHRLEAQELSVTGNQVYQSLYGDWPAPRVEGKYRPFEIGALEAVELALRRSTTLDQAQLALGLAEATHQRAFYDRLPTLNLSANRREEESTTTVSGRDIEQDDESTTYSLVATLDLIRLATGSLAYRQAINERYMAEEALRQAELEIVQDTYLRYWRAQAAINRANAMAAQGGGVSRLMDNNRTARAEGLVDPATSLDTEERLVGLRNAARADARAVEPAMNQLRDVLMAPPSAPLVLTDRRLPPRVGHTLSATELEFLARHALYHRGEMAEASYEIRNAILDGQIDIWRLLDSVSAVATLNLLETPDLTREAFSTAGSLSENLINLATTFLRLDQSDMGVEDKLLERELVAAGIVTEVLVAANALNNATLDRQEKAEIQALRTEKVRVLRNIVAEGSGLQSGLDETRIKLVQAEFATIDALLTELEARIELAVAIGWDPSRQNNQALEPYFGPEVGALFQVAPYVRGQSQFQATRPPVGSAWARLGAENNQLLCQQNLGFCY